MDLQRIADILVASWTLAEEGQKPLTTSQGVLDRALLRVIREGSFPDDFRALRFVETRVGLRCPELSSVLSWALASEQTSDPNPSYQVTDVKPSVRVALALLDDYGVPAADAKHWGKALFDAVREEEKVGYAVAPG